MLVSLAHRTVAAGTKTAPSVAADNRGCWASVACRAKSGAPETKTQLCAAHPGTVPSSGGTSDRQNAPMVDCWAASGRAKFSMGHEGWPTGKHL